jgi:hypothetical protein
MQLIRMFGACILVILLALPRSLFAQSHVVSTAELQTELLERTRMRQHNLEIVHQFLSSQTAKKAFASAHVNANQVQGAVSGLSDLELADLASRVNQTQTDFAAGRLTDREQILIALSIIGLALLIVVLAR